MAGIKKTPTTTSIIITITIIIITIIPLLISPPYLKASTLPSLEQNRRSNRWASTDDSSRPSLARPIRKSCFDT
jgi:hypothetical protein